MTSLIFKKVSTISNRPVGLTIGTPSYPLMIPTTSRKVGVNPRVFQLACRRFSLFGKSTATKNSAASEEDNGLRIYEKDVTDPKAPPKRLAVHPEFEDTKRLRAQMRELENELKFYRSTRGTRAPDRVILSGLKGEEREKVAEALRERHAEQRQVAIQMVIEDDFTPLLRRLNEALSEASIDHTDPKTRKELWRWYSRAKQSRPILLKNIQGPTWELMWKTIAHEDDTNEDRMLRIYALLQDMLQVGHKLTPEQELLYIESTFLAKSQDEGLAMWEDGVSKSRNKYNGEYLELGVRMYSIKGDVYRAKEKLSKYLDLRQSDPRIITPVIRALNRSPKHADHLLAFVLYVVLRERLQGVLTMRDYDEIIPSFLEAKDGELAAAVFRDMMETGQPGQRLQQKKYEAALARLEGLNVLKERGSELNKRFLGDLFVMPKRYQNKFFYHSWLKKLIGDGQIDAAGQVVELMYERGVFPDARVVNGLVGARLRSGTQADIDEALGTAWAMVQKRLDFVARRSKDASTPRSVSDSQYDIPAFVKRPVPSATIETFSILITHHLKLGQIDHAYHLAYLLRAAEIPMNAFIMNHLIYAELRKNGPSSAYEIYRQLSAHVPADLETFACLWDCKKQELSTTTSTTRDPAAFPTARDLLHQMITWFTSQPLIRRLEETQSYTPAIHHQILRCFNTSLDLPGLLVAMHLLKHLFGHYPTPQIATMMVKQTAHLLEIDHRRNHRELRRAKVNKDTKIDQITRVLAALRDRRMKGVDVEEMSDVEREEENLNLLSEFLRVVMVRKGGGTEAEIVEGWIDEAGEQMGVGEVEGMIGGEVRFGDKTAGEVGL